jgi:hypothetical protein
MSSSRAAAVSAVALALAAAFVLAATTAPARAATPNSPSCLRGNWVASTTESRRVLRSLVPGPYEFTAKLKMIFQNGIFQYGTDSFRFNIADTVVKGSILVLARYTAVRGAVTIAPGTSTVTYSLVSAKGNIVSPPPEQTTRIPGGRTPFQCRGNTLKYKLPRLSSLGWITLQRGH